MSGDIAPQQGSSKQLQRNFMLPYLKQEQCSQSNLHVRSKLRRVSFFGGHKNKRCKMNATKRTLVNRNVVLG